jgi:hypothetical protein
VEAAVIDVMQVSLPKDRLRSMPKEERALLFLLGYAANQITLFSKLVIFSTNKTPHYLVEQRLADAQSQILVRAAIGVLAETWELIRKRFLTTHIGKELESKLNPVGREALDELKKYFGRSNLLSTFRNKVAFHHPCIADMDAGFEAAAGDTTWDNEWNWYFSHAMYNSFYLMSEVVTLHAILNAMGETDLMKAHERLGVELKKVSEPMIYFIFSVNEALLVKHLGATVEVVAEITDAPGVLDVGIPFYVEVRDQAEPGA